MPKPTYSNEKYFKQCTGCGQVKEIEKFGAARKTKFNMGKNSRCKECIRQGGIKNRILLSKIVKPDMQNEKIICSRCGITKSSTEFSELKASKTGLSNRCKQCHSKLNKIQYYKHTWDMTLEDLDQMKKEQNFKCACCGQEAELVIDHNHETGLIRKLLCNLCNNAIGYIHDDPNTALKIVDYLQKHAWAADPKSEGKKCLNYKRASKSGKTRYQAYQLE